MRAWALCSSASALLLLSHLPYLSRPYFWDEAGQFIPASLDLYHSGELIAHSTIPNVHPPAVMMWLAGVWHVFGYSIVATRVAMLAIACAGVWCAYRLAADFLCPDRRAAMMATVLLCVSPLFFSQSMMALLDMPAMTFTLLALLLFLQDRLVAAAAACVLLVLVKETGLLLPAIFGMLLVREHRVKQALLFFLPALPLLAWLVFLHERTGNWFGNSVFAHYNLTYPLNPVRLAMAFSRRAYYLFGGTGYIIGTLALLATRKELARSRAWTAAIFFSVAHVAAMCVIGGAVLERYLLPVLPMVLAAFANALCRLSPMRRNLGFAAMCVGSLLCIRINPIYPFPLENNLAWTDFVEVHREAATYLSTHLPPDAVILSSFPFAGCMRRPELGYATRRFRIEETPDFTRASLDKVRAQRIDAFALFSATWDPFDLDQNAWWVALLRRFYDYEPEVSSDQIPGLLKLRRVARFERHGQWIDLFQP